MFYALDMAVQELDKKLEIKFRELRKKLLERSFSSMNSNQQKAVLTSTDPL